MGFIKVRAKREKEESVINTNVIVRIVKHKDGCIVFFSGGDIGTACAEYDAENAKKIFQEIGVSL